MLNSQNRIFPPFVCHAYLLSMRTAQISFCVPRCLCHLPIFVTLRLNRLKSMACSKEKEADSLKQKRPSLSLGKRRFSKVSEAELSICKKKPTSANTERAHQWALRVFEEWVCTDPNAEVSDLWSEDAEKVCHLLSKFAAEARQFNGKPYTPKTLLQLMTNLQSQAFAKNPRACNFMDYKDVVFKPLHNVLNNMSKKLLSQGVGAEKKQARVITDVEEDMLWEKKGNG